MTFASINNAPFGLGLQQGLVNRFSGIHKFGLNTAVGSSFETIWDGNNIYTYASAGTATATSSDTDDNTGTVEIQGLDENYDLATETLTIGGSAGSTTFSRN